MNAMKYSIIFYKGPNFFKKIYENNVTTNDLIVN